MSTDPFKRKPKKSKIICKRMIGNGQHSVLESTSLSWSYATCRAIFLEATPIYIVFQFNFRDTYPSLENAIFSELLTFTNLCHLALTLLSRMALACVSHSWLTKDLRIIILCAKNLIRSFADPLTTTRLVCMRAYLGKEDTKLRHSRSSDLDFGFVLGETFRGLAIPFWTPLISQIRVNVESTLFKPR